MRELSYFLGHRPLLQFELIGLGIVAVAIIVIICYVIWCGLLRTKKKLELYPKEAQKLIIALKGQLLAERKEKAYINAELGRRNTILKTVQDTVNARWPAEPLDLEEKTK